MLRLVSRLGTRSCRRRESECEQQYSLVKGSPGKVLRGVVPGRCPLNAES